MLPWNTQNKNSLEPNATGQWHISFSKWLSQSCLENVKVKSHLICNEHVSWHSVFYFVVSEQSSTYNNVHNDLRPIDGWENFLFTTSETKCDH